ncbi:MAG TPA: hypothetical protein VMB81_10935 [Candidatus Sulfotelmatobacter sp.]|nr:hypothetical protein [Candidatus Sulfotelmatobacter sp.]
MMIVSAELFADDARREQMFELAAEAIASIIVRIVAWSGEDVRVLKRWVAEALEHVNQLDRDLHEPGASWTQFDSWECRELWDRVTAALSDVNNGVVPEEPDVLVVDPVGRYLALDGGHVVQGQLSSATLKKFGAS